MQRDRNSTAGRKVISLITTIVLLTVRSIYLQACQSLSGIEFTDDPYLGQQQETIERRSSNLSYASRLPPGASSPKPTFRPLSPAGATTASVYDDYRSNTPHLPEDHGLLDRNGTLRSVESGGQKLGIANPSVEGH